MIPLWIMLGQINFFRTIKFKVIFKYYDVSSIEIMDIIDGILILRKAFIKY